MQTKGQIRQLLASAGIRPKKRLGQNFLIDLNLINLLLDSANISDKDTVLEAGCGTGSLTEALAERAGKVIAVEIDPALAEIAKRQLSKKQNVEVYNADILESKHTINKAVTNAVRLSIESNPCRFLLVANLPYDIASALVLNLITGPLTAEAMYVTVQKEVAGRMTAEPGCKDYGTLSIYLGATGEVKTIRILKPTVFWPQPAVDSAMVSFVRSEEKANRIKNIKTFSELVNLFMTHRRKMLKACTKLATGKLAQINNWLDILKYASINPHNRPDQLCPDDFLAIANLCCQYLSQTR